jgi:hypothetical protein
VIEIEGSEMDAEGEVTSPVDERGGRHRGRKLCGRI